MGNTKNITGMLEPKNVWRMQKMLNPIKEIWASIKESV